MASAAALFATRPFHEVRLDDIAEAASVGKGTLYIYFKSKDELYGRLVLEGLTQVVNRLKKWVEADSMDAWETLTAIVRELVCWAKRSPHFFQLTRPGEPHTPIAGLREKRQELAKLIEKTIVRGVRAGVMVDPRPDLTAQFLPSCIRGALRFAPTDVGQEALTNHILRIFSGGILRKDA